MRYWMLLGLLFSAPLWADTVAHYQDQRYGYIAGNLGHFTVEEDKIDDTMTPTGVNLRLGGMMDPNWGGELRVGAAPSGDTFRTEGTADKVDYSLDHVGALLGTFRLPFKSPVALPMVDSLYAQGFAGGAAVRVKTDTVTCQGAQCSNEVSRRDYFSFAFGAGVGIRTEFNLGLSLQYMQYTYEDPVTVKAIEGGLEWYF